MVNIFLQIKEEDAKTEPSYYSQLLRIIIRKFQI